MDIDNIKDWIILNFRKNDIFNNKLNKYDIISIVDNNFILDANEIDIISYFIDKYTNLIYEKYNNKK